MTNLNTIARPYAQAAFDFATQNKCIDKWKDMLFFASNLIQVKKAKIIYTGVLGQQLSIKIFLKLCNGYIDSYFINFIKIMSLNKRLFLFTIIYEKFVKYLNISKNIINMTITTSNRCIKTDLNKIKKSLQKKINRKILLANVFDDSIIGGIIFKVGDCVFDNSIRIQLEKLQKFLKNNK